MAKSKSSGKGRDVMFRVGVTAHPESKKSLKDLGDEALRIQKNLDRSMARVTQTAQQAASAITGGIQSALRTFEQQSKSTITGFAKTAIAELESMRRSASAPFTAATSGVHGPVNASGQPVGIKVPMSAGEKLDVEREQSPVSTPRPQPKVQQHPLMELMERDPFSAGMAVVDIREGEQRERDERIEREANLREDAAARARQQRADEAARRKEQAEIARERAADDRERAREAAARQKQVAKSHAEILDRNQEFGRQQTQRTANVQVARQAGLPASDEAAFAQKGLQEQEKVIASRISKEVDLYKTFSTFRGQDLAQVRQAIQGKIAALGQLSAETKRQATEAHAVESRAVQQSLSARQRAIAAAIAELKKLDTAVKQQAAQENSEAERLHSRHRARQHSIASQNRKAREQAANELKSDYSEQVATVNAANSAMAGPLMNVTESIGRTARGFLSLGLLSEESTEDMLRGWVRIQAMFDILVGGTKAIQNISRVTTLWTAATTAAQSANAIHLAATAQSTVALQAEAVAAGAAATAHTGLATARTTSAAAGAASAAGSAAGGLAKGAAGKVAAEIAKEAPPIAGAGVLTFGAAIAAFVGGVAGIVSAGSMMLQASKHGIGGGADKDSITDKIATKEASVLAFLAQKLGNRGFDALTGSTPLGMAGQAAGFFEPFKQLAASNTQLERAEKQRAALAEAAKRKEQLDEDRKQDRQARSQIAVTAFDRTNSARDQRSASDRDSRLAALPAESAAGKQIRALREQIEQTKRMMESVPENSTAGINLQSRLSRLQKEQRALAPENISPELTAKRGENRRESVDVQRELNQLLAQQRSLESSDDDEMKVAVGNRIVALQERLVGLSKDTLQTERQISEEKRKATQEAIQGIQAEIDARRNQQNQDRQRFQSAKEQFGDLDPEEQARLVAIKRKSNAAADRATSIGDRRFLDDLEQRSKQNPASITDADQRRAQQIRDARADAAAKALTGDERRRLSGIGLSFDDDVRKRGAVRSADRAGFDKLFGQDEKPRDAINTAIQKKLQVELKDKREFEVKIERDDNELARRISNDINANLDRRDDALRRLILEEVNRRTTAQNEQQQRIATQRNTTLRG